MIESKRIIQLTEAVSAEIEWEVDEYPDLSWLGEYTDRDDGYVVDRVEGVFLGDWVDVGDIEVAASNVKPQRIYLAGGIVARRQYTMGYYTSNRHGQIHPDDLSRHFPENKYRLTTHMDAVIAREDIYSQPFDENGDPTDDGYRAATELLKEKLAAKKIWITDADLEVDFDDERQVFYIVNDTGRRLLADNLGKTCFDTFRQLRYWEPGDNHVPHDPKSWKHVDQATKDEIVAKHGSLEQQDILYAVEDWKRMEDYEDGGWCMTGCTVTVRVGGFKFGRASLWGIESDSHKSHIQETERDLLAEALRETKEKTGKNGLAQAEALAAQIDPAALVTKLETAEEVEYV
ncbi:hypothetical protein Rctr85_054 [Virus Rctr85]|nr:hypothetical protein Rctr85_054 [Virus Rctr85]